MQGKYSEKNSGKIINYRTLLKGGFNFPVNKLNLFHRYHFRV